LIPALNKQNVIQAVILLGERKASGILGIVDCDYTFLENKLQYHPNLVYTDYHDLEVLLILSPALENILREFVPGDKLHLLDDLGKKIRSNLFALGIEFGHLRWANYRENLGLNFRSLPYSQIADPKRNIIDTEAFIRVTSVNRNYPLGSIENKLSDLRNKHADYKHVCQGHDLVNLLELVIPTIFDDFFGIEISNSVRPKCRSFILDDSLRLGFEKDYFVSTKLYLSIKNWEQKNLPFLVLC
jgi:hypothetical protein